MPCGRVGAGDARNLGVRDAPVASRNVPVGRFRSAFVPRPRVLDARTHLGHKVPRKSPSVATARLAHSTTSTIVEATPTTTPCDDSTVLRVTQPATNPTANTTRH